MCTNMGRINSYKVMYHVIELVKEIDFSFPVIILIWKHFPNDKFVQHISFDKFQWPLLFITFCNINIFFCI